MTTTDFTYEGDAVVREVEVTGGTTVTRTFTTDEAGAIVKMTLATTGGSTADDGTYLVTGNGHGDTIGLAEIDGTTGVLTPAARRTEMGAKQARRCAEVLAGYRSPYALDWYCGQPISIAYIP